MNSQTVTVKFATLKLLVHNLYLKTYIDDGYVWIFWWPRYRKDRIVKVMQIAAVRAYNAVRESDMRLMSVWPQLIWPPIPVSTNLPWPERATTVQFTITVTVEIGDIENLRLTINGQTINTSPEMLQYHCEQLVSKAIPSKL